MADYKIGWRALGKTVEFPYGMFDTTEYKIVRLFGDGVQAWAELQCTKCPDERGIGTTKVVPLCHLESAIKDDKKGGKQCK